jgi:glycosyltransferase involved in cell wall biosynthesis
MNNNMVQVILPLYNEEENVPILIEKIFSSSKKLDMQLSLILINDGSTDSTDKAIQKIFDPTMMNYFKFDQNMGYSAAIKKGIQLCNPSDFILMFDSDNQFDFSEISKFLNYTKDYDIIIGRRSVRADKISRVILGKIWSIIGRLIFQTKIDDLNCGFKLFKATLLKDINIVSIGPGINLDIFSNSKIKRCSIKQIDVTHFPRKSGVATGSSLKTLKNTFVDLFRISLRFFFNYK